MTVSENRANGRHIPIASPDRPAYLLRMNEAPVVLLDDAHTLDYGQLGYLLRAAASAVHRGQIHSLVLFGMPELSREIQRCRPTGAKADVINTLYMPPLSETETQAYLHFRFGDSDYDGTFPCSPRKVRKIHRTSGGIPGQINRLMTQGMASQPRRRGLWCRISLPGVFRGALRTPAMAGST